MDDVVLVVSATLMRTLVSEIMEINDRTSIHDYILDVVL